MTDEGLVAWSGRYIVHADELCLGSVIILAQFRYVGEGYSA